MRIRAAIMEQNLRPGFTNKLLARRVDRVFTTYSESAGYLPGAHVVETGNPVRWQKLPVVARSEKFTLLVLTRLRNLSKRWFTQPVKPRSSSAALRSK